MEVCAQAKVVVKFLKVSLQLLVPEWFREVREAGRKMILLFLVKSDFMAPIYGQIAEKLTTKHVVTVLLGGIRIRNWAKSARGSLS